MGLAPLSTFPCTFYSLLLKSPCSSGCGSHWLSTPATMVKMTVSCNGILDGIYFSHGHLHHLSGRHEGPRAMRARFRCEAPCNARWNTPGPLNRHQTTCEHWKRYEASVLPARAEDALQPRKKRRKISHKKVQHPVHSCDSFLKCFIGDNRAWRHPSPGNRG